MLQRYAVQVITAGKADEVVADSGGPLPDHSVFTGHLIEALRGKGEAPDGILTANTVMSYVYEHVSKDPHSQQTPHYGLVDGDGDFIFKGLPAKPKGEQTKEDDDKLISIPAPGLDATEDDLSGLVNRTKAPSQNNPSNMSHVLTDCVTISGVCQTQKSSNGFGRSSCLWSRT